MQNQEIITRGFGILLHALAPYVAQQFSVYYGPDNWWTEGVLGTLYDDQKEDLPLSGEFSDLVDSLDIANTLRLMDVKWNDIFRKKLNYQDRNWLKELQGTRNKWAHHGSEDFSDDDTWRALDTMSRLANDIDPDSAEEIRTIQRELRYGSAQGSAVATPVKTESEGNKQPTQISASTLLKVPDSALPSWRDIITPNTDVAEGRYKNADFAVDLAQVAKGEGPFEYRDPTEFFNRTYVTDGMRSLLKQTIMRLSGKGGEPVLQLKTAFGGGKTHSMLAVYHLVKNKTVVENIPIMHKIISECGVEHLPNNMHVAVLNGTTYDPTKRRIPQNMPGISISTLWGEMTYQLALSSGKPDLYNLIKESDRKGISPGNETLANIFDECGTCVILIDELVAYARKLEGKRDLPAGTSDNFLTFVQELTEAAKISKSSIVIASIPESDDEIGGEAGQKALEKIEHTFGRVESIWKPVAANEGFEIVRRRLFTECKDPQARDEVCKRFSEMYLNNPSEFPIDSKEVEYRERLQSCYPFHPEIFDLLYDKWATIEHFHKTRGVLRLMAALVHNLWINQDNSLMIMPGSLTLSDTTVKDELLRYLDSPWNSIVDKEIDGKSSIPYQLDATNARFGGCMAAKRIARTIMLGSAPSTKEQNLRGIDKKEILLGVVQPGENISIFSDALSMLQTRLTYLYSNDNGDRFWFDTRPTLRKTVTDRASTIPTSTVDEEVSNRLQRMKRGDSRFAAIHITPSSSYDVPDEQSVRLVILGIDSPRTSVEADSKAIKAATEFLNNRGNSPRIYKNTLAFVAPSGEGISSLRSAVRMYLAWKSIQNEADQLNLDKSQIRDTENAIRSTDQTVDLRIKDTYCWLLVPRIDRDNLSKIVWDEEKISAGIKTIPEKAQEKMFQQEMMIDEPWSPAILKMTMDSYSLWKEEDYVSIKDLWGYLTTYCYLPRLLKEDVLLSAIERGVTDGDYFTYADGYDGKKYLGLKYKEHPIADRMNGLIVKLEPALKQIAEEKVAPGPINPPQPVNSGEEDYPKPPVVNEPKPPVTPVRPKHKHFAVSIKLDNTRVVNNVSKIYDEIISQITNLDGADVEITLNIEAEVEDGFDESTERTLTENCRTLKSDDPELY